MSAISILYSGDHELPSWSNYESEEDPVESRLLESNYIVPILWFSLFSENDLSFVIDPDGENEDPSNNRIPMLVRRNNECLKALDERTEFLLKIATNCMESIEKLRDILITTKGSYISVSMWEVFYMDDEPEEFIQEIQKILKLFNEQSTEHIASLLKMAGTDGYDHNGNDYLPEKDCSYEYHAIGIAP